MNDTSLAIASALGWVGAVGTVGAYALVSTGRMKADSIRFQVANVSGVLLLSLSSATHGSWPSAISNVIWMYFGVHALIGARDVIRAGMGRRLRLARLTVLPVRPHDRGGHDLAA